ncbi:MAG: hypothetical protein BWK76_05135 [Desulfobulbaceae bacterium A2]|nr:MAG: hypothetical protein BWK76_05135 [Desulfobulbaceae bacterium A2]
MCLLLVMPLAPIPAASAETLADIDQEIQADLAVSAKRQGLDAYNISEGVTDQRLERKIQILLEAGINRRFFQSGSGVTDYTNFYSFTSRTGVTDTKLDLVTTGSPLRLYRRGSSGYKEASAYLGSWWGDKYRGIQGSRDEQAILAAWGSDLQRIYVIDVPAGYTLVGGLAAPMERDGEYRPGGAYQYYYRGALTDWLVYALYAPDYLQSYAGAVTGAQKVGRSIVTDLGGHINQTRSAGSSHSVVSTGDAGKTAGELWLRGFGGTVDFEENDGSAVSADNGGMSIGWQRLFDVAAAHQARLYWGVMLGQGLNVQTYETSGVETSARATVGGIYGVYINSPESARSWYGSCSLVHGGVRFTNTVPGELGYGLDQEYSGNITVLTVENGISFQQHNGWTLEPQIQASFTTIGLSDFDDNLGARVSLKEGNSLWGRVGVEVRKKLGFDDGSQPSVWTRFSYVHDFSNRNEVLVAGDLAVSEFDHHHYLLALGADVPLSRRLSLQGQIAQAMGGESGTQGNLSLKYIWQ